MIYTTKEDGKTILWGMTTDDKDDAYETVTDKNDVVIFRQVDTGKDFVYNDGDWYEFATSGGGGGGGTGGGVFVVTIENDRETYSNPSATFDEMLSANEDGKAIILVIKNTQDADGSQYGLRNITTTEAVFQSFYADSNPAYFEVALITCTSSNVWSGDGITLIGD